MSQQVGEKLSHFVFFICVNFFVSIDFGALAVSPLQTWETSSATMTGITGNAFSAYNGDSNFPECIFVFGGNVCTDCSTLFCYNITSDELYAFGDMDSSISYRYSFTQQTAFIISDDNDDLLYYIAGYGNIYYYDLNNPDSSDVLKTSIDVTFGAMVKNPDDTEFYVIDGYSGGEFYVYDLVENEIHQGSSLNVARVRPGVTVNEYYEDPYIYIMGGKTSYIERINLNDARNNEWELLQLLLQNGIDDQFSVTISNYFANTIVSYANYVYLIGGYDGTCEDDIIALDVANWDISWAGVFPTITSAMPATLAGDRVYTFGGWLGSAGCFDTIYISNSFDDICESSSDCTISNEDDSDDDEDDLLSVSPLQTWEFSEATMTGITGNAFSAYNEDSSFPECIFVFGGNVCTDCDTLFCYNITSDELYAFGDMDSSISARYSFTQQTAFIISDDNDDLLYYITGAGDVYTYDLNDPDSSDVLKTSIDVTYAAMVKHPNDIEFYVIDGNSGGEFYVHDLVEHEIHQGNDLNVARQRPGVTVNEYYDDPYIYVLGGYTSYIERIKINGHNARDNKWELLQLLMQNGIDDQFSVTISSYMAHSIVSYANYIYLIGGYDGTCEDDIIALDVGNWEIEWAGVFPTITSAMPVTLAKDRVYTFGGWVGSSGGCFDDIYISNSFDEIGEGYSCSCPSCPSSETTQYPNKDMIDENTKLKEEIFALKQQIIENNNDTTGISNYYNVVKIFVLFLAMTGFYFWTKKIVSKCSSHNNNKNWSIFNQYEYQSIN